MPLQKENERLVKENNVLHLDVIKAKEELEQLDLKWKGTLRQFSNECQDLKFLVEQKDIKIRKSEGELTKVKSKLEKVMSKMYMPGQDEIVEGLAQHVTERGEQNMVMKANHHQDYEITHPLQKYNNDISEIVRDGSVIQDERQAVFTSGTAASNKQWADELTKADDRSR